MASTEYKVNRCSRRCSAEERPLRDGEAYVSVIVERGEELTRRDYSAAAWTEPPEGAIGWWKGRMPEAGARKMVLAPNPVLIDLLRQMEDSPHQAPLRYLLALTLLRRRVLRLQPGEPLPSSDDSEPGGGSYMRLQVVSDGSEIDVRQWEIRRGQIEPLSDALQELLYCEATD